MGTGIRGLGHLLLASAVLLGSACGDDGNAASTTTTTSTSTTTTTAAPEPVEGLVATVGTNRLFQPRRELGLGLRNVSGAAITVTGLQLVSDRFAPVDPGPRTVVLPPGRRLVIPLPYGPVRCDGSGAYEAAVVLADGRRVVLPAPEDRAGSVDRVHERECAAGEVRELVDLRFEGGWARDGVAIEGELVLERRQPGPPVAVDDVTGNVIFTLRLGTDDRPVLTVDGDRDRDVVPITISADRCDSHAVAEFKRPMVFLSWVAVDGGELTPVELEASGEARAALEALLASC